MEAGRQLESDENGSAKLHFGFWILSVLRPSAFTRVSRSQAETGISVSPHHMSVFISNKTRPCVKHYQKALQLSRYWFISLSIFCKHLKSLKPWHNCLNNLVFIVPIFFFSDTF